MNKPDSIFVFGITLFLVDLLVLFVLSNTQIHLRSYGYLTLILLLPASMIIILYGIVITENERGKNKK